MANLLEGPIKLETEDEDQRNHNALNGHLAINNLFNFDQGVNILGGEGNGYQNAGDVLNDQYMQLNGKKRGILGKLFGQRAHPGELPEHVVGHVVNLLTQLGSGEITKEQVQSEFEKVHEEYGNLINPFNIQVEPNTPEGRLFKLAKEKYESKFTTAGRLFDNLGPGAVMLAGGIVTRKPRYIINGLGELLKGGWQFIKGDPEKIVKATVWLGKNGHLGEELEKPATTADKASKVIGWYKAKNLAIMQSPLGILFGLDAAKIAKMAPATAQAIYRGIQAYKNNSLRDEVYNLLKGWKKNNVSSLRDVLELNGMNTAGIRGHQLLQMANEAGLFDNNGSYLPPDQLARKYNPANFDTSNSTTFNDDYVGIGQYGGHSSGSLSYGADVRMQRFYAPDDVGALNPAQVLSNGAFNKQAATQPQKFVFLTYEDPKYNSHYYDCKIPLKINIPSGDFGMYKVIINEVLFRNDAPLIEKSDWLHFSFSDIKIAYSLNSGYAWTFQYDSNKYIRLSSINTFLEFDCVDFGDYNISFADLTSLELSYLDTNSFINLITKYIKKVTLDKKYYITKYLVVRDTGSYTFYDTAPPVTNTVIMLAEIKFCLHFNGNLGDLLHFEGKKTVESGGKFFIGFSVDNFSTEAANIPWKNDEYYLNPGINITAEITGNYYEDENTPKPLTPTTLITIQDESRALKPAYYWDPDKQTSLRPLIFSGKKTILFSLPMLNGTANNPNACSFSLTVSNNFKHIFPKLMTQNKLTNTNAYYNNTILCYIDFPYFSFGGPPLYMLNTTAQTTCPISNEDQKQFNVSSLSYNTSLDALGIVQLMSNIELILKEGNDFRIWLTDNYGAYVRLQSPMYLQVTVVPFNNATSESMVQ